MLLVVTRERIISFLKALAVVAERPDLILRLFGGETARTRAEH